MTELKNLITDNIDIWTCAIKKRSATGRGSSKKIELTGVKKLRELILELAIRGKLVPQNPDDEPASVLLKRISGEKEQLIVDKRLKNQKLIPPVPEEEKPFELPQGWSFERIGNLVSKLGSGSTPRGGKDAYVENGVLFFRSQNIWNDEIKLDDVAFITKETHQQMSNTKVIPGDILLNITGASLGRSTIFPNDLIEANVSQHVTIIRLIESRMNQFLHMGILSPLIQKLVWGRQVGMAIEGLSKKVLEQFEFPVPPLVEQHRIVAKVDELMVLCDELEQQTEQSISAHQTLVRVLLNTLTASEDAQEFTQNWSRIAEHFDTLFTTEDSIEQLKQIILQLAVMGKLVSQDTNNEPASELLKKIAVEKAQLIAEKKITKQKPLPEISEADRPFILPIGWSWSRLGNIYDLQYGNNLPKDKRSETGEYPVYGSNGVVGSHNECCIPDPCIVIGRKGSAGALNLCSSEGCWVTDVAYSVIPSRCLDIDFVFKSLHTFGLDSLGKGIKPGLNRNEAYNVVIAIPPFEEQKRIAAKTEELFELCEQIRNQISNNQIVKVKLAETFVKQSLSH